MCPLCFAAAAQIVGAATSVGELTAFALKLDMKIDAKQKPPVKNVMEKIKPLMEMNQ